jgi:hypothetical protein
MDGLTLKGTAQLGSFSSATFSGTETLGGTGTFRLDSNNLSISGTDTVTVGPNLTIHGSGSIGGSSFSNSGAVINQGTITVDTAGKTLSITAAPFTNSGTLQVMSEGSLAGNTLTVGKWATQPVNDRHLPRRRVPLTVRGRDGSGVR